jgi:hypothetical protein
LVTEFQVRNIQNLNGIDEYFRQQVNVVCGQIGVGEVAYVRFMCQESFNPTTVAFVTLYDVYENRAIMDALHNREFIGIRLDVEAVHFGLACLTCHQDRLERMAAEREVAQPNRANGRRKHDSGRRRRVIAPGLDL